MRKPSAEWISGLNAQHIDSSQTCREENLLLHWDLATDKGSINAD